MIVGLDRRSRDEPASIRRSNGHLLRFSTCGVVESVFAVAIGAGLPALAVTYGIRDMALFLLAAGLMGLSFIRPRFSIVTVIATFVFSGLVRRLFPAIDPAADLAAVLPFIVAIPLAVNGLRQPKPVSGTLLVGWVTVAGTLSFGSPLVALAGWLNLAVPLLVGYTIPRIPGGLRTFARTTVTCGAIAATYGIVQYFVAFPWDLAWLADAGFVTAGQFGEETFRPFATLPAPLTAAMLCAVVILLVMFRRDLLDPFPVLPAYGLAVSTVLLLLTQVRSVWVAVATALLVALLIEQGRTLRRLATPVLIVVLVVVLSPVGETIRARAQTLADLESDVSYQARFGLLGASVELFSPIGRGLGALSAGSRIEGDTSIDNGYLVVLGEIGVVGLVLVVWAFIGRTRPLHRRDVPFVVVMVVANASALIIANLPGLLMWTLIGTAHRRDPDGAEGSAGDLLAEAQTRRRRRG